MEIREYLDKKAKLNEELRKLDIQFSEEHPITKRFKNQIVKAYDNDCGEWTEKFVFDGIVYSCGHLVVKGTKISEYGNICDGWRCEVHIQDESDIDNGLS